MMTPENFVYWLQGYFELKRANGEDISDPFLRTIEDHLKLVFEKETPDRTKSNEDLIKETPDRTKSNEDLIKEFQEKIRERFPEKELPVPSKIWPYPNYPDWIPPSDWKGPVITC